MQIKLIKYFKNKLHSLSIKNKRKAANVIIDKSSIVDDLSNFYGNNKVYGRSIVINSNIEVYTYIGMDTKIYNSDVGKYCSIASNVCIGLGLHPTGWMSTSPVFYSNRMQTTSTFSFANKYKENKRTRIGNDVWIGAGAIVIDGVNIQTGAIVAAGSVVTSDVDPYCIVGGTPAKIIRRRLKDDQIEELLSWEWWNLPPSKLKALAELFTEDSNWTVEQLRSHIDAQDFEANS
jgi:chloramphenicol O-acetyltransferase type B